MSAGAEQILKRGRLMPNNRNITMLTWNPDRFDWGEGYLDAIDETSRGLQVDGDWSTGGRKGGLEPGDTAFLLRQGTQGRGIVARGEVTSEIFQEPLFDDPDDVGNYVLIRWDRVMSVDDALSTETLKAEMPEVNWDRLQMSGTLLKPALHGRLEQLWSEQVGS